MPKAYRTNIINHPKFKGEIGKLKDALHPEHVGCPEEGCTCTYEMYGCQPSNRESNIAILQERLKKEHPSHTSEVLGVNQYRRPPR